MSIAVIGDIFVDIKGYSDGVFIPKGRNPGHIEQVHGGVGRNVAEDLARMGVESRFVALADDTGTGEDVINRLKKSGVDVSCIARVEGGMGTWLAIFDETKDVAANISIRPDLAPLTQLVAEKEKEIFQESDSIILEIDVEEETVDKVFELAEKYNRKVYALVSVMSIALKRRKYFSKTECFVCNIQEAGMMFERELEELAVPELEAFLLERVKEEGFSKLIVTLGEKGSVYADKSGETGFVGADKVVLVDSTGAGDSFTAGVAAALTEGKTLRQACTVGTKVAANVITRTDNVCEFLHREELGL